jgi:tetratricopeptide (TPR) repeat protein
MRTFPVLVTAALVAAAASAAVHLLVANPPREPASALPSDLGSRLTEIEDQSARLAQVLDRLAERVDQLGAGESRTVVPAVSDEQVRSAVAALLQAEGNGLVELASAAGSRGASDEAAPTAADVEAMFGKLTAPAVSWEQRERLWKEARDSGLIDEMVEKFEALAEANPQLADAQAALGDAYLQKLFTVPDNEKGDFATRADKAFDAALTIDSQHWEARFAKAVSLSFWPAFLGKGPAAMEHFGILMEQQESAAQPKPGFAQTYLFLGNMYEQRGESEKAREIWQRGYTRHPDDTGLREKVQQ